MERNHYLSKSRIAGRRILAVVGAAAMSLFIGNSATAQSVGISGTAITPSTRSMLEVRSTSKGLLIPRMTEAQRLAIAGLVNTAADDTERGMLVYQYDNTAGYYTWNGTTWIRILDAGSAGGWLTTGNTLTTPGTNFLGTTDNVDLRIKTNNVDAFNVTASGRLHAYQNGTAAAPVLSWNTDDNMGMYRIGADILGFSTAGVERIRISANGNVGIGDINTAPFEKLQVHGNIRLTRDSIGGPPSPEREIYVANVFNNNDPGTSLTIRSGDTWNGDPGTAKVAGDLVLQAGTGYVEGAGGLTAGGDIVIRSGSNFLTAVGAGSVDGGDIVFETGQAVSTYDEKMRIREDGEINISSLAGVGSRVVEVDALGNLSATSSGSSGTVTSIATGTGLTGGPITTSGTLSMADMAALSVKGNATNASAAPTDIAAASDFQVFRRNGTTLGFGAINLASSAAVTGILPVTNGGTGSSTQNWVDLTTAQTAAGIKTWSDQANFSNVLRASAGAANAPSYSFSTSPLTGMYLAGANEIAFSTNSAERMRLSATGELELTDLIGTGVRLLTATAAEGQLGAMALGTSNQVLKMNAGGTALEWGAPAVTSLSIPANTGDMLYYNGTNWVVLNVPGSSAGGAGVYWALTLPNPGTGTPSWAATTAFTTTGDDMGDHTASMDVDFDGFEITDSDGEVNVALNIRVNGKMVTIGINETSDARFKKDVSEIKDALATVKQLEGVTYNWDKEAFPDRNFSDEREMGVIAQQVETLVPEVVRTDEDGFKTVQYGHLVPLLIEAIKEQQTIIDGQQNQITSLQAMKDQVDMLKASVELLTEHIRTSQK